METTDVNQRSGRAPVKGSKFPTPAVKPDDDPSAGPSTKVTWSPLTDVLTTASFPCTGTLRTNLGKGRGTCSCSDHEVHVDFFTYCKLVVGPNFSKGKNIPHTKVCWNAENIWECKLPRELTGLENRVQFESLRDVRHALQVLAKGTYWAPRLLWSKAGSKAGYTIHGKALGRLLAGRSSYNSSEKFEKVLASPLNKGAVSKLRNILATVDGLLMQFVLGFPGDEDILNWDRLDQISHCLIVQLISDYFRDHDIDHLTTFEKVKRLRKAIKREGFNDVGDLSSLEVPRELSFFQRILDKTGSSKTPIDLFRVAILCQTRASGVPPYAVFLKTQEKIKASLTVPPDPLEFTRAKPYIKLGVEAMHDSVVASRSETERGKLFTRCMEAAKVSLSDSGEFFSKVDDGGKLEAARLVLSSMSRIQKLSLDTGQLEDDWVENSVENQGEVLFLWACHQFRDRRTCYDRNVMSVRISLVAELGKYRAITVSHLAHSVLLHVLSHVLLTYMGFIPSSASGIQAGNHAWNFFKRLSHKNPAANFVFGNEEMYLLSTDWETATDHMAHEASAMMLNLLCRELGIPEWYRQTVSFALFAPRQIEAKDRDNDNILYRYFTTRGVLMGDPVTKVVLHMYHIISKYGAERHLDRMRNGPAQGPTRIR